MHFFVRVYELSHILEQFCLSFNMDFSFILMTEHEIVGVRQV